MEIKPNIVLIDDERIYRETLPLDLKKLSKGRYSINHVVANRRELFILLENQFSINIILLDLQGIDGFGILEELQYENLLDQIEVIVVSNITEEDQSDKFWETHLKVFNMGAKSLIPKNQIDQLSEAIHSVTKGFGYFMGEEIDIEFVFDKQNLKKRFVDRILNKESIFNRRQKEILRKLKELIGELYFDSNEELKKDKLFYNRISDQLNISNHTVRWHCEKMKELLDEKYAIKLHSLAQILIWAVNNKQI